MMLVSASVALAPLPALAAPAPAPPPTVTQTSPAAAPTPTAPLSATPSSAAPASAAPSSAPTAAPLPIARIASAPSPVAPSPVAAATPSPQPPAKRTRSGHGLVIAGLSVLGTSYAIASLSGALGADSGSQQWGARMMLPVVGPFLAARHSRSYTGAWFTGLFGVAQVSGLIMTAVGVRRLRRYNRARHLSVAAAPTRHGAQLGASMRF